MLFDKNFIHAQSKILLLSSLSESGAVDVVYSDTRMVELTAPYVPGYLAFREAEPLVRLINSQRENKPELTPQVRKEGVPDL